MFLSKVITSKHRAILSKAEERVQNYVLLKEIGTHTLEYPKNMCTCARAVSVARLSRGVICALCARGQGFKSQKWSLTAS